MSDLSVQTLYAEAMLGRDAEEFLNTDLGKYLLARAEEQEQEAMEELATVFPWNRWKIQRLQNKLWQARSFKDWLKEMIVTGRQALAQLDQSAE